MDNKKVRLLDVCYLLDTTGSMDSWIQRCKRTIRYVSDRLNRQNLDIQFNMIGYKDICDRKCDTHDYVCPLSCNESNWIDVSGFTNNINELYDFLDNLKADGGGDVPEDLFGGLQVATLQNWRENSKKVIVLITDAPPHGEQFSDKKSYTPNYPLQYEGAKNPEEVLKDITNKNIQILLLNLNECLDKTYDFIVNNNVVIKKTSLIKDPWKFSLIIPDDLTTMSVNIEDDVKLKYYNDKPFTSMFFNLKREMNNKKIKRLIKNCYESGMKDTMRLIMYIRDRNGNLKEKNLGRNAFWSLRQLDNFFVSKYYKEFINTSGCVNDLLYLAEKADLVEGKINHTELLFLAISTINSYMKHIDTKEGKKILSDMTNKKRRRHKRILKFLNRDCLKRIVNKDHIDIPAYFIYKWLPKFGSTNRNGNKRLKKWERTNKFATRLSKIMFVDENDLNIRNHIKKIPLIIPSREITKFISSSHTPHPEREVFYREIYSFLGKISNIKPVEVLMCAKEWEDVELEKITSGAQNKYKKCFIKRIPEKVNKLIEDKKVKTSTLDGTVMVSHFIRKILSREINEEVNFTLESKLVNSQWESFYEENKILGNYTFQIDNSGSMLEGEQFPLAIALKIFLLSGNDKFISFDNPGWCSIKGDTLEEKVKSFLTHMSGYVGDIPGGMKLAMEQQNQPSIHFVITDGNYPNMRLQETIQIRNKMNIGELTKLIIINLNTNDELTLQTPDMFEAKDVYIISGTSAVILDIFLCEGDLESYFRKMLREKYPLIE